MPLPTQYAWLAREGAPQMLVEAVKLVGTLETAGTADNPKIIAWADEVSAAYPTKYNNWAANFYDDDGIAWCGLAQAICAVRAGREPPNNYLSALAWAAFGEPVAKTGAMLGDILVFTRKGGGHVAQYVGEDDTAFHIIGGNQSDAFTVTRKAKAQLYAVRRPKYNNQPVNVRKVVLKATGALSVNEA
jgi:uncharacterized protein (TIGR02594 family)